MKTINFHLENDCAIVVADKYFDLHNEYLFTGFRYDVTKNQFEHGWVSNSHTGGIAVIFKNINFLKLKERDPKMLTSEDDCLRFLGYLHPSCVDEMNAYTHQVDVKDDFHMIFQFEGGQTIKVYADSVEIKLW